MDNELTKREQVAMACLAAMLSNSQFQLDTIEMAANGLVNTAFLLAERFTEKAVLP